MREGRLDLAEYERRVVLVQAAKVRKDLTPAVADLPGSSGRTGTKLRVSAADRERALVRLAGALTDGRLEARAYADAEELLNRAVTYADVDAVVGDLDAKASHTERDQAIARIEAAVAGGLLEPAEQHDRVAAVRRATTDAQLAALVADLPTGTGPARSPRASHADREAVVAQLHDAVEAGVLDLPEFDERVRAVYAARLRDELTRLVADLPHPEPPPAPPAALPPAPPIAPPPRQQPSFGTGMTTAKVAAAGWFVMVGIVVVLGVAGLTVPALVLGALSAIVFVGILVWAKRTVTAAMEAESAPHTGEPFLPAVEPFPDRGPTWVDVDPAEWTPKERALGRHKGDLESITALVLPDGTPVAVVADWGNHLRVLNLANGKPRFRLTGHTQPVNAIDSMVLADGTPIVVSAGEDKTIRVWDLGRQTLLHTITGLVEAKEAVVCTALPDGTPVVVACDWEPGNTSVWNLRDGSELPFRFDLWGKLLSAVALPDRTLLLGFSDEARAAAVRQLR
ncbi:hypothetical protein GCM10017567_01390 [Amycolatopsis bullii]|uniref:DUF1707 domain-containing protein n=1 Tax=Amycolatopsis bullii TaxID=941987 RepID=A0ABQ3JV73_9PSEU|nr:hypothetical protein GCM10017567_01390 [Amycolatopsis bullii]